MDTNCNGIRLTDYALTLIHHKAQYLVGKAGFTQADVEDIKQDLIADLWARLPKFDPAKATYNTFVARVVERKICNILRDRQAEMRDYRREDCSLNDEIDVDEEGIQQRIAMISQDEHDLRTGRHSQSAEERADLTLDVEAVLADLTPETRQAAEMLRTMTIAEVIRELGIPRSTFYDNQVAQIRAAFVAHGYGDNMQ